MSPSYETDAVGLGRASATIAAAHTRRTGTDKHAFENAKAAAGIALEALNLVAALGENVPYLGAIATALTAFKRVMDEVDACKEGCRAAMKDAEAFENLLYEFQAEWGYVESNGKDALHQAFRDAGNSVLACLYALQSAKVDSQRWRDRLKLVFKRDELQATTRECRLRMKIAKERFSMTVAMDTNRLVHRIHRHLQPVGAVRGPTSTLETSWRRRAAPAMFFGREAEVDQAIDLISHQHPARVAILGSGGIGKTSIALSVLHHPGVLALYGDRRCFVSCEAIASADGLIRALSEATNLNVESDTSAESARHRLLSHLTASEAGVICLDNMETPWNTDMVAIEGLLADLASLPSTALIVTSRVMDTPLIEWSTPALEPIMPFSVKAALQTWDVICKRHDHHAVKLVNAVECVPLAVVLLARLARFEPARDIWRRWEKDHTDLIHLHDVGHRLNNLAVSIELSLRALHDQDAVDILSILSIFPYGLKEDDISRFEDILEHRYSVRRAIATLQRYSLAYIDDHEWYLDVRVVRVLSPIRHHISQ
ncbi:unnamed protein product [Peniophora sp. CBMAI 1063]|nr:unnamed protein product [Peniophora sp. CBMAI 1063]